MHYPWSFLWWKDFDILENLDICLEPNQKCLQMTNEKSKRHFQCSSRTILISSVQSDSSKDLRSSNYFLTSSNCFIFLYENYWSVVHWLLLSTIKNKLNKQYLKVHKRKVLIKKQNRNRISVRIEKLTQNKKSLTRPRRITKTNKVLKNDKNIR